MVKKKTFFRILSVLILAILLVVIFKNMTKNKLIGNNMNSQQIVDKILNLNSYKAKITVQVNSNKNKNKYILLQEYNTENGCVQEVIEPENIAGTKIIKKDNNLTIENTQLELNKFFENYKGLEENSLDLINFIEEYKKNSKAESKEKNEEIILKIKSEKQNPYIKNKALYINKKTTLPTKLIVQDNNQNTTISIEYNEIELN